VGNKMSDVKVFAGLPEECFGVLKATNELIVIKRGEMGYYPQRPENEPWGAENVDHINEDRGITKAQRSAMEAGSLFGWDVPMADPSRYDEEGKWIKSFN
jgi:hypothetical protein